MLCYPLLRGCICCNETDIEHKMTGCKKHTLKTKWLLICICVSFFTSSKLVAQKITLKTNLLYDATATVNLGAEIGLASQWTLDVTGNYNAWNFSKGRRWRHLMVQPEARYWFCERFNGHFIGLHAHWMKFNIGNVNMPFGLWDATRDNRFEGDLYGGGFTYGHQWLLGIHWNLEAALGIGYARVIYDRYPCKSCGRKLDSGKENYFGPTKAVISLVYLF